MVSTGDCDASKPKRHPMATTEGMAALTSSAHAVNAIKVFNGDTSSEVTLYQGGATFLVAESVLHIGSTGDSPFIS